MATRLPKALLTVRDGLVTKGFAKALRAVASAIVAELPAGVLAEVGERSRQLLRVQVSVKGDQVQMRGHEDVGVGEIKGVRFRFTMWARCV
jgi:hypothetical protein